MEQYLLSLLIFTPLSAAFIILLLPESLRSAIKTIAVGASILQVAWILWALTVYKPGAGFQLSEKAIWISFQLGSLGKFTANYFIAVDGLSMPLVVLSVFVLFIATIASLKVNEKTKAYFILILILNASVIGSFVALDLLLFYLFFEFMLLPMYFLIGIWGGPRREYASIKFLLYTLLGSILILIAFIALYISYNVSNDGPTMMHTFNMLDLRNTNNIIASSILDPQQVTTLGPFNARLWVFLFLFIGFAIKLPMVPLHTWLPDAHVEASTPISVILAALLLKIGGYGLLRIAYPILQEDALYFASFVAIMGVISIIYGALNAMGSKDLKRLIAYSSVSHMGFVLLGIASSTHEGVTGAVYQMVSHGILSAMLFILAGVLYDQTKDRTIINYSGLAQMMPKYFAFILIAFFASLGLPGFSGFIGEIFILLGAFKSNSSNGLLHPSLAIIATGGLILGAGYFLWTIQRMFFGTYHVKGKSSDYKLNDLNTRELSVLLPLAIAAIVFGVYPQPLLEIITPFTNELIDLIFK